MFSARSFRCENSEKYNSDARLFGLFPSVRPSRRGAARTICAVLADAALVETLPARYHESVCPRAPRVAGLNVHDERRRFALMTDLKVYRILDAAANRGREALRVVEDATRFLEDSEDLTRRLKELRHLFATTSEKLDRDKRLAARDTVGDVGTSVETSDEYERASLKSVLVANFARLEESARSLEEFSKLVEPQLAKEWEQIRYRAYTLEKIVYEALRD